MKKEKEKKTKKEKLEGSRFQNCIHAKRFAVNTEISTWALNPHCMSDSSRPQIMTLSLLYRVALNPADPVNYLVIAVSVSECPG